jgi:hypothetical protein
MFREYNAGQNLDLKIGNKSSERLKEFTYLEITLKHQNSFHETMKNKLTQGKLALIQYRIFLSS